MRTIIAVLLVMVNLSGFSQEENSGKIKFNVAANFTVSSFGDIYKKSDVKIANSNLVNKNENRSFNGIKTSLNYFIKSRYSVGMGVGVSAINYSYKYTFSNNPNVWGTLTEEQFTLPVFVQFKALLKDKESSLYGVIQAGFYPDITNKWSKGRFIELGVGYQLKIFKKKKIGFRLSYNYSAYDNNLRYREYPTKNTETFTTDGNFKNLIFTTEFYL